MEKFGSGIRDGKIRIRDPGWKYSDPGWKKFGFGIRDGKKFGSGINILDPQHCFQYYYCILGRHHMSQHERERKNN
jgi:hypothetical protein